MSDAAERAKEFSDHAKTLASRLRLPLPQATNTTFEFPQSMATLGEAELSEHLTHWAALSTYAEHKVAILRGALLRARAEHDEEFAVRCVSRADKTDSKTKRVVAASDTMRRLNKIVVDLESDLIVLEALAKGYERKYQALSREITRRGQELGRKT